VSSVALTNIATLVTNSTAFGDGLLGISAMKTLVIEDGKVAAFSDRVPEGVDEVIDCSGKTVLPGFVDSHTHLVFAGDRSAEFAARSRGEKYSAGGIKTTVAATRAASDAELTRNAQALLDEALAQGTTTVEIKSGYGLTLRDELRSLDIASAFTDETTLLAAHVIPEEFASNPDGYVDLIINEIIPASSAKWIDVFCDAGAFSPEQTRAILQAGKSAGLN
jgi:imidazolonepropionase